MAFNIADCRMTTSSNRVCNSPTDSADLDLHKYAIRNGLRMEKRVFPCTSSDYIIEVSDKLRKSEIVDMLVENFLHDETLIKSLRMNAGDLSISEKNDLLFDERLIMETVVDEGTVLLAINKSTNRISGTLIIMVHDREEMRKCVDKKSHPHEGQLRSNVIKDFFKYIKNIETISPDIIFAKYPNCKLYAEFELIGVNKLDRNKGIAYDLYKAGLSVIKDIPDVSVLSGVYTSIYSQKIAIKIGKEILTKFDVTKLKDDSGRPVFQDTIPHNFITLMAMEI